MEENVSILEYFDRIKEIFKLIGKEEMLYADPDLWMPDTKIEPPVITYRISNRQTDKRHTGMKPSIKYANHNNTEEMHGQLFDSDIIFSIYGKKYDVVSKTRDWFESFMIKHNNKLKKRDIIESVFKQQLEDEVVEINSNYYIRQSLVYFVKTPRVFKISYEPIQSIETEIMIKEE